MLAQEITDFRRPVPPYTDERVRVFQSGDKENDGRWFASDLRSETALRGARIVSKRKQNTVGKCLIYKGIRRLCPTAGSRRRSSLPDAARRLVLADHRRRRLNPRHQGIEGAAGGHDPETANSAIAGGVGEANYGR
jgi:hypothetical protein